MDPATIAILVGALAASSAASLYTNSQNIKYAQEANEESVALANTAHQREVRDLRAAGLNPILSASGSGSSVPQLKVPSLDNPLGDLNSSAGSIASAVNGTTRAAVRAAEADAVSAEYLRDLNGIDLMSANGDLDNKLVSSTLETIENNARLEALTGIRDSELSDPDSKYYQNSKGRKVYNQLVNTYRKQIAAGEYTSGVGHAIFKDVRDGISSAKDVGDLILTGKKVKAPLPNPVGKRGRIKK